MGAGKFSREKKNKKKFLYYISLLVTNKIKLKSLCFKKISMLK